MYCSTVIIFFARLLSVSNQNWISWYFFFPKKLRFLNLMLLNLMSLACRIHQHEHTNKMSLHNLATVFGPTLLRPGTHGGGSSRHRDPLAAGTVDVMAQAGILYHFLQSFVAGEIRSPPPPSPAPGAGPASSVLSSLSSSSSMASWALPLPVLQTIHAQ